MLNGPQYDFPRDLFRVHSGFYLGPQLFHKAGMDIIETGPTNKWNVQSRHLQRSALITYPQGFDEPLRYFHIVVIFDK